MKKQGILFGMAFLSLSLHAATPEVIDLGSLKVEGAARGPEVRLIDAGQLDAGTSEQLVLGELEGVEKRLLGLTLPEPSTVPAAAKPALRAKGRKR